MSMVGRRIYLDHNATSPIRPEALAAANLALQAGGNPSSVHASGRAARDRIEQARTAVAALANASSDAVIFTSGGSEANAMAIRNAALSGEVGGVIVGATEHEAVMGAARACGLRSTLWPVDADGVAELDWLASRLADWPTSYARPLVALMLANNETGVIQPVAQAAALVRAAGGWLHVDAVQAAGRVALDVCALGADTLALSAHKIGGPQGAGALLYGDRARLKADRVGGGQERGLRGGTENVSGIAGFGAAARAALRDLPCAGEQAAWRDAAATRLSQVGARIAGAGAHRLPQTLCIAREDFPSALQVMSLDLDGVEVSAGAACSSGKLTSSGVLEAMGYGALAAGALRASGGWNTIEADWKQFADVWLAIHARRAEQCARVKEYA